MSKQTGLCVTAAFLALAACSPDRTPTSTNTSNAKPQYATSDMPSVSPLLVNINKRLAASGAPPILPEVMLCMADVCGRGNLGGFSFSGGDGLTRGSGHGQRSHPLE